MTTSHLPAATTCWTEIEESLCTILPQLAAFRTLCGVTSAEAASDFVWMEQLPEPADGEQYNDTEKMLYHAHAIVSGNGYGRDERPDGTFNNHGILNVTFGRLVDVADLAELDAINRTFKNQCGAIIGQLLTYVAANGGVPSRSFSYTNPSVTRRNYETESYAMIRTELRLVWRSF